MSHGASFRGEMSDFASIVNNQSANIGLLHESLAGAPDRRDKNSWMNSYDAPVTVCKNSMSPPRTV
jgi:hypothetical protein